MFRSTAAHFGEGKTTTTTENYIQTFGRSALCIHIFGNSNLSCHAHSRHTINIANIFCLFVCSFHLTYWNRTNFGREENRKKRTKIFESWKYRCDVSRKSFDCIWTLGFDAVCRLRMENNCFVHNCSSTHSCLFVVVVVVVIVTHFFHLVEWCCCCLLLLPPRFSSCILVITYYITFFSLSYKIHDSDIPLVSSVCFAEFCNATKMKTFCFSYTM